MRTTGRGGQLFKQIHKFFGSKEHKAKIRGFRIGQQLLKEAADAGVKVVLGATVEGLYLDKEVTVKIGEKLFHYKGDAILVAHRRLGKYGHLPRLDAPGCHRRRSRADDDEFCTV